MFLGVKTKVASNKNKNTTSNTICKQSKKTMEQDAASALDSELREIFQLVDRDGGGTSKCTHFSLFLR